MSNPIWITLDDGDVFEGHQLHWANTFFSNATRKEIESACAANFNGQVKLTITEMTDEQLSKYPEALAFEQDLIAEYGEA